MKQIVRSAFLLTCFGAAVWSAVASADIVVTRKTCNWLVQHQAAADVEFKPGVDVHGGAVAPADLEDNSLNLPDMISIPIKVLIADRYGIPANSILWEAEAEIGVVDVVDGQVRFNGQSVGQQDQTALARLCRDRGFGR